MEGLSFWKQLDIAGFFHDAADKTMAIISAAAPEAGEIFFSGSGLADALAPVALNGMTFDEMALAAGFRSRSSTFHHCQGVRAISAESAMKYHHAFGIPLSELRPDLWPPPPEPDPTDTGNG